MPNRPRYQVSAEPDGPRWFFRVIDVPGAIGQAETEDRILAAAREVISLMLDVPEHSFDVERRGHSKWSEIKRRKGAG